MGFRNWFAGHIDPGSIGRNWNSRVTADSYCRELGLGGSRRCILVGRSREQLRQGSHCKVVAGVDSLYFGCPCSAIPRRTAIPRVDAKGEH